MSDTAYVTEFPQCDLCPRAAEYDSRLKGTSHWAYLCARCYRDLGFGRLGTGFGQRLRRAPAEQTAL